MNQISTTNSASSKTPSQVAVSTAGAIVPAPITSGSSTTSVSVSRPSVNLPANLTTTGSMSTGHPSMLVASGASSTHSSTGDFQQQCSATTPSFGPTPHIGGTVTPSDGPSQMSTSDKSQHSVSSDATMATSMLSSKDAEASSAIDWRPAYPRLCAYHDCNSLAAAWGIGPPTMNIDAPTQPTGASMAQSPAADDDGGDGKTNELLASCPAFRNELGGEPIRRVALSRQSYAESNARQVFNRTSCADNENETWHREHTASEAGALEDVSNVYLGGRLCAARQSKVVIEPQDIGSYYYRHCFAGRSHVEYFGNDEQLGPIAVSMVRETSERKEAGSIISHNIYRLIVRISDLLTMRVAVPEEALQDGTVQDKSTRSLMRELLEIVCPQLPFSALRPAVTSSRVEELVLKIDEQPIYTRYKVGVLYCCAQQSTEAEMYNNEHSSPALDEFLDFLGQRVRLKGFDSYKGGLDTRGDTTGLYSVYTEYASHEVMFHVSTMLPYTPNNKQQLSRKRHIGNDMVTIIFQEPDALPFSPITVRSHFQHVFIVVRVSNPCTENVSYGVAVSRVKDVPAFGPALKPGATYQKCADFHDFLLTKIINAENAVHRSKKFAAMAKRTRREALKDLVENYVTTHSNEGGPARIASRLLGGSVKRRERQVPRPALGADVRGALSWMVEVHERSLDKQINAVLGVSADTIVLMDIPTGAVIFATPTHAVLGWANTDAGLKIYYDHGDVLSVRCSTDEGNEESSTLVKRLDAVTNGEEAKELILRKPKPADSWGFHLQEEGVVTDVEMYATAWKIGLRQGSRVVEIDGRAVVTLTLEQMSQLLAERSQVRIMMIAPTSDGNPRRGCEDSNCPAIRGQEALLLTPDTFAKQPLTYQEMFKIRNRDLTTEQQHPNQSALNSHSGSLQQSPSPAACFEERSFSFGNAGNKAEEVGYRRPRPSRSSMSTDTTSTIDEGGLAAHTGTGKKYSAPVGPPIPPRSHQLQKASAHSNSFHDSTLLHSIRAGDGSDLKRGVLSKSDDPIPSLLGGPNTASVSSLSLDHTAITAGGGEEMGLGDRNLSFDDELTKYQWWLQKTMKEKRDLELLNDKLSTELAMERRAHESTRRYLSTVKRYCQEAGLAMPEQADEDL